MVCVGTTYSGIPSSPKLKGHAAHAPSIITCSCLCWSQGTLPHQMQISELSDSKASIGASLILLSLQEHNTLIYKTVSILVSTINEAALSAMQMMSSNMLMILSELVNKEAAFCFLILLFL